MQGISSNNPLIQGFPSGNSAEGVNFAANGNSGGICGTPGQRHRHKAHCQPKPEFHPPRVVIGNGRNEVNNFMNAEI